MHAKLLKKLHAFGHLHFCMLRKVDLSYDVTVIQLIKSHHK